MKTLIKLLTLAGVLCAEPWTMNAAEKVQSGPRHGRLLEKTTPTAEFVVQKDHTISIYFYDAALKPVPVGAQNVTVYADAKGARQKIEFVKKGDALTSTTSLPQGDGYNLVVQLKPTAEAKPQNFRFLLDMSTCSGCQNREYACACHE